MIISKTPFRVSFIGGGTDLPLFYNETPGNVISTTINKYMYISTKVKFDKKILVNYSQSELVDRADQIKHPLAREILKIFKIKNSFEVSSMADIPAFGSGLGSSSAYTVGLINNLSTMLDLKFNKYQIADLATKIEIDILKDPVGKQDQFASSFGGLRKYTFNKDKVKNKKIFMDKNFYKKLENSLIFFYIGNKLKSGKVLKNINSDFNLKKNRLSYSLKVNSLVDEFEIAMKNKDLKSMGEIINLAWIYKKEISPKTSNSIIEDFIDSGIKSGAYGGKLLGAGGGGFVMFICKSNEQKILRQKFKEFKEINFKFDNEGSRIIYRSK